MAEKEKYTMLQEISEDLANWEQDATLSNEGNRLVKQARAMYNVLRMLTKVIPASVLNLNQELALEYDGAKTKSNTTVEALKKTILSLDGDENTDARSILSKEILKLLNQENKENDDKAADLRKKLEQYFNKGDGYWGNMKDIFDQLEKYKPKDKDGNPLKPWDYRNPGIYWWRDSTGTPPWEFPLFRDVVTSLFK